MFTIFQAFIQPKSFFIFAASIRSEKIEGCIVVNKRNVTGKFKTFTQLCQIFN